ncbi:DUF6225 family protein [Embleya sp. MST-111070]|uniref:DUF6225 family protein n=1 Tax=Embleya sp. MST-111070 TaxID=3398231 RepID=UPI003F73CA73
MTAYARVHHVADVWTVGRLRAVLADLPDDAPLMVAVPEGSPGTEEYAAVADTDWSRLQLVASSTSPCARTPAAKSWSSPWMRQR